MQNLAVLQLLDVIHERLGIEKIIKIRQKTDKIRYSSLLYITLFCNVIIDLATEIDRTLSVLPRDIPGENR
jgi:hypothetical protein